MIDQVIGLTLERSIQRQWLYVGRMTAQGVPLEKIWFFRGADAKHYRESYEAIARAAEADGYGFVKFFQGYTDKTVINQTPAQMCQVWSWGKILKHIAEGDKITLVTWDDRYLSVPHAYLEMIVTSLIDMDPGNFHLFQLRLRGLQNCIRLPEPDDGSENYDALVRRNAELFRAFTDQNYTPNFVDIFTRRGYYGYDESIVFSPAGARWMLDAMQKMQDIDPDIKQMEHVDMHAPHFPVYLSRMNIDSYLCWDFRKTAELALKEGKGLYCPRYPGYDFIEDAIPMGSLTQWGSHERPDAEVVNATTDLQYIE